jgi:hypothetical protein
VPKNEDTKQGSNGEIKIGSESEEERIQVHSDTAATTKIQVTIRHFSLTSTTK